MASIEIALLDVPEGTESSEAAMIRARYVINALFAAYGNPDVKPETSTLTTTEVEAAFTMALALLHSTEGQFRTRKDFRDAAEHLAKNLWKTALVLRDNMSDDDRAEIGLESSG